ncbi:MAG: hypothetical protein HW421_802 [Ignavibacteria bacterium]|nr:hypothetical protein [Ignavibacteria bacterium]
MGSINVTYWDEIEYGFKKIEIGKNKIFHWATIFQVSITLLLVIIIFSIIYNSSLHHKFLIIFFNQIGYNWLFIFIKL